MASGFPSVHQRKLGPAPIASFEDLSDEVENGEQQAAGSATGSRMPGIVEVVTPATPGSSLKTPSTPRIDISRASSSSQHEDSNSRESSPERELLAGAEPPTGIKLILGYKEDAQDLRSSTEELDLQDPIHEQDLRRESKKLLRKRKDDCSLSEYGGSKLIQERERKDSNCSEIILLNISGRTSRLSSVGSQGSGVSGKLSIVSATSSRSPSPHKCLLETSFCGNKPTLAENVIESSKPETEDLEKILLKREADTTKALIPESIKVPMVGGNIKPDPLDKPRRRGREERKEIFKREVEITKKVLEKVNIEVPIIRKPPPLEQNDDRILRSQNQELQKPVSLDFNDKRKVSQNFKEIVQTTPTAGSVSGSPKLPRHQKVKDLAGSRTPSPSSVSRKSSFTSLFKARTDGSVLSPESPTPGGKSRRSLTSKIKDTTESFRSRSKSRERVSIDKGNATPLKKESKNKGVFSSTLSLFKKRERKKSYDEAIASSCGFDALSKNSIVDNNPSMDSIGRVEFTFNANKEPRKDDSIFISLHADDRNYEEALPSESVSIPLETPTKLFDEYESEPRSTSIVTEVSIEHHGNGSLRNRVKTEATIETRTTSGVFNQSSSKESQLSKSSSRDGINAKPSPPVVKPKRKSKQITRENEEVLTENEDKLNGKDESLRVETNLSKTPSVISDLDHNSSESERDSEIDFVRNKVEKLSEELPDERKGLFYEESFEEDLPYVPNTLPLEKSAAVPILPVKQRLQEVRTIPTERPRSTTPINPTLLDEFVMQTSMDERRVERMKISLPREDSFKLKSPRKHSINTFSEFAGKVQEGRRTSLTAGTGKSLKSPSPPPPLPPRARSSIPTKPPSNWINFEEIPEKRKAPKRIQTVPRTDEDSKMAHSSVVPGVSGHYNYVQPEECRCECHEESRRASQRENTSFRVTRTSSCSSSSNGAPDRACNGENCPVPSDTAGNSSNGTAIGSGDRASLVSDSSMEGSLSIDEGGGNFGGSTQALLGGPTKPFGMDLDVKSNRSSIISQEETDENILQL